MLTNVRKFTKKRQVTVPKNIREQLKSDTVQFEISDGNIIMKGGSPHVNFYNIGMILLWIATGLAILSAVDYFRKFLKEIVA